MSIELITVGDILRNVFWAENETAEVLSINYHKGLMTLKLSWKPNHTEEWVHHVRYSLVWILVSRHSTMAESLVI